MIVTLPGLCSAPASATMPVMAGKEPVAVVSTYSKVAAGPGRLDSSSLSVTMTSTGPAPSWGAGASGGLAARAGGNVAVIVLALRTVNLPGLSWAVPTSIAATSDFPPEVKPVPVIVTCAPPAVLPDVGARAVTIGLLAGRAAPHRE